MRLVSFATIIGLSFGATGALAASSDVGSVATVATSGRVLIDSGAGYVAAVDGMALKAGDQIMVGEGGSADIYYAASDCTVSAGETSIVTVSALAPCAKGETLAQVDQVFVLPVEDNGAEGSGLTTETMIVGGLAITSIVGLVAYEVLSDDGVSAPAN
jgi:hypothetical protein